MGARFDTPNKNDVRLAIKPSRASREAHWTESRKDASISSPVAVSGDPAAKSVSRSSAQRATPRKGAL